MKKSCCPYTVFVYLCVYEFLNLCVCEFVICVCVCVCVAGCTRRQRDVSCQRVKEPREAGDTFSEPIISHFLFSRDSIRAHIQLVESQDVANSRRAKILTASAMYQIQEVIILRIIRFELHPSDLDQTLGSKSVRKFSLTKPHPQYFDQTSPLKTLPNYPQQVRHQHKQQ